MKIDLLYLAHNRLAFTSKTLEALLANTDWDLVKSLHIYDDGSSDGTRECLHARAMPRRTELHFGVWGSPVAIMNEFVASKEPEVFAKIDNDTMLPPGWLNECVKLMDQNPTVDLLGIEPMHPVQGEAIRRYAEPARYIGGIGLMRGKAFVYSLPRPDGRFGFTAWQDHEAQVVKAWINPALPVCLLDRVPFAPWSNLSAQYVAEGWQRPWEPYGMERSELWDWWHR